MGRAGLIGILQGCEHTEKKASKQNDCFIYPNLQHFVK
jgi:hypothetical protein